MKKIILIALCGCALATMAKQYGMTYDENQVMPKSKEFKAANKIADSDDLTTVSNHVEAVDAKFQIDSVSTNGVTIAATTGGAVTDTGIPIENFQWQAGVTNVSQLASFVASGDQPNAYPKLDENGKIKTNAIPVITIYFTGGPADPAL